MTAKIKFALASMIVAVLAGFSTAPAIARGGAPNIMDSPGYQRRLQESRQQYQKAYTIPPAVYPGRKWRHRRHHYH